MSHAAGGRITVIIPTLNEAENVDAITTRVFENMREFDVDIIIVDDGSNDGTQEKVGALAATNPVRLLERKNATDGLAGAVLAGARRAASEVVVVMDADLSHPPERLPDLVRPVLANEKDMVIGSRYAPGGSIPGWPMKRRIMSRAASALAWPLTDVHDSLSGFFAVRRELLATIPPNAAGFKIALEVLVRGGDTLRVAEIPITFGDRTRGESKMKPRVIFTYFRRVLALSGWRGLADETTMVLAKNGASWLVDFIAFCVFLKVGKNLIHAQKADYGFANLTSYTLASIVTFYFSLKQRALIGIPYGKFFARFLLVRLMAVFLRGGVLAFFTGTFAWPPPLAILPAIIASAAVSYLGFALFIWPMRENYGHGIRWRVASMGITIYLIVLRLAYFQEGIFSWFCFVISSAIIFRLSQKLFDKSTAFRALMLFQTIPYFFFFSFDQLLACWAAGLYFLNRTSLHRGMLSWLALGTSCVLFWGIIARDNDLLLIEPLWLLIVLLLLSLTPNVFVTGVMVLLRPNHAINHIHAWFLKAFILSPFFFVACLVFKKPVLFLWLCPNCMLMILPLIAQSLESCASSHESKFNAFIRASWPPTFVVLILAYGALLYEFAFNWPWFLD